ncbi:MAG: hypothetical protein KY432_01110, partial [Acidobacteria bacterium]|nr:hypothetical protein [Acidobacteriota bacterium]
MVENNTGEQHGIVGIARETGEKVMDVLEKAGHTAANGARTAMEKAEDAARSVAGKISGPKKSRSSRPKKKTSSKKKAAKKSSKKPAARKSTRAKKGTSRKP